VRVKRRSCRDLSEMSISQLKCPRDVHMDISDAGRPSRSCGRRFHSASASLLDRGYAMSPLSRLSGHRSDRAMSRISFARRPRPLVPRCGRHRRGRLLRVVGYRCLLPRRPRQRNIDVRNVRALDRRDRQITWLWLARTVIVGAIAALEVGVFGRVTLGRLPCGHGTVRELERTQGGHEIAFRG